MSGQVEILDRTFFVIGGTQITLAGLLLVVLIAAATLAVSWAIASHGPYAINTTRQNLASFGMEQDTGFITRLPKA